MMFLTAPLLTKNSFLGSLVTKIRFPTPSKINISTSSPALSKTVEEQVGLPPRPKKPLTPYFRYMKELRPKIIAESPTLSAVDIVRKISKSWETASVDIKQRLQDEFRRDQQAYVEKRAKYDAKVPEEKKNEIKELKQALADARERRVLRKRIKELGKPKKPASAFLRYVSVERQSTPQLPEETYREWHKKCSEKWSKLSDTEKQRYINEARIELDSYKKVIATWEEKMIRLGHTDVVRSSNLIDPPEPKSKKRTI